MTTAEHLILILMAALGTMLTRFLPFLLFPAGRETPPFIRYLGRALPAAVFGMLVIYCLKNVTHLDFPHGIPEVIALVSVLAIHLWKRRMLLSIACGTVVYMVLVQVVF